MTPPPRSAPDGYLWRPITAADLEQWAVLLAAIEAVDQEDEHVGVEELTEFLDHPDIDFPRGTTAAFDAAGNGEMVAYGMLQARNEADPEHLFWVTGAVHPDHRRRGLGNRLLNWAKQASVPLHEERFPGRPMSLVGNIAVKLADTLALFERHGYQQSRWFNGMAIDLTASDLPPALAPGGSAPEPPDGVVFVPFTAERSADALRVRNESFVGHWGSTATSTEAWAHRIASAVFRPGFTYLAYERTAGGDGAALGEPLALVLGEEYEIHQRATGKRDLHIALVGTLRAARGRGIATALLTDVLRRARAAGFDSASLGVDSDSPTGATRLYSRIGFEVQDTVVAQLLPVVIGAGNSRPTDAL